MKTKYRAPSPLDLQIQRTLALGMDSGVFLKLEYVYGFERFGSYETWAGGYRVTDERNNIRIESRYLEDAVALWTDLVAKVKAGESLKPWQYNVIPPKVKDEKEAAEVSSK